MEGEDYDLSRPGDMDPRERIRTSLVDDVIVVVDYVLSLPST